MNKYRVIISGEFELEANSAHAAREEAIRQYRRGEGDWEITYVGRASGDDEVDVTDQEEVE